MARTFESILEARIDRRDFLRTVAAGTPLSVGLGLAACAAAPRRPEPPRFASLPPSDADDVRIAPGYSAQVLLRWGDPLFPDAPPFDVEQQTAAAQRRQFGPSCDYNAFVLLGRSPGQGLLCVNHEYAAGRDMFLDYRRGRRTAEQVDIEIAAHGMSIAQIARAADGTWGVLIDSKLNRRITADTPMRISGPAAGAAWMRTAADPDGTQVLGMLSNCGGGRTPWGTILTCEENTQQYFSFAGEQRDEDTQRYNLAAGRALFPWAKTHERFDLSRHPNEAHRFGWVVEIDPLRPDSTPVKRTALGRFSHESATVGLAEDGRVVVYSGDDNYFEYLYKFVSDGRFDPKNPERNRDLLDSGTLYAARFDEDGSGEWLPLLARGPLADWSPPRLATFPRRAADILGATPMDRPEDVELNPLTKHVFVCLTNNTRREQGDGGANPRPNNQHGHVVELAEADGDQTSTRFSWSIFLLCGDPSAGDTYYGGADVARVAAMSCPDNIAFDSSGNLWLTTDGQPRGLATNDAVYAIPTAGAERGLSRRFLTGPVGCEMVGPELTSDERTLFVGVQHPGGGSGLLEPTSRWPHDESRIPRPGVLAVRRDDGGVIGS